MNHTTIQKYSIKATGVFICIEVHRAADSARQTVMVILVKKWRINTQLCRGKRLTDQPTTERMPDQQA